MNDATTITANGEHWWPEFAFWCAVEIAVIAFVAAASHGISEKVADDVVRSIEFRRVNRMNSAPTTHDNWTAARELEAHLEWLRISAVVGYQQHSTDLTVYVRHRDEVPRVPGSFRGRRITTIVREPDYAKGTR